MVKIKIGRETYDVDDKDLIFDNGSCYQLVTKKVLHGSYRGSYPLLSKKLFRDLKNCLFIYTNPQLAAAACTEYGHSDFTYWKFDIEAMKKMGYEQT